MPDDSLEDVRLLSIADFDRKSPFFYPDETDEVTAARIVARECHALVEALNGYRRLDLRRLARERSEWPF